MKKVVVVGDINIDIITPPFKMREAETSTVLDDFTTSLGGNAINVAAQLHAMEHPVVFLGGIGDDAVSQWIIDRCQSMSIPLDLAKYPGRSAGITFAITHENGKRQFIATLGTNKHVKMEDLNLSHLENASHLHRSGFWYTPNLLGKPTIDLFKKAKELGVQTSLDVGWAMDNFSDASIAILKDTLQYCDVFFANEKEICAITRIPEISQAIDAVFHWVSNPDFMIVLHRGEKGSAVITKDCRKDIPAILVDKPVNPTGTGDIFNATFIYGLVNGFSNEESAKIAARAASIHLADICQIYPKKSVVLQRD